MLEEARQMSQWDQTLTMLWFDDEEVPVESHSGEYEEESGLNGDFRFSERRRKRGSRDINR